MKKKIVIWILSAMMVFVSIVSGAAFAETQDDNTEVLEIYTEADLRAFADSVNIEGQTYEGKTVSLMKDITLEKEWIPVGTYPYVSNAHPFRGTFQGNGHVIRNLVINEEYTGTKGQISIKNENGKYLGFFGGLRNAEVNNLELLSYPIQ